MSRPNKLLNPLSVIAACIEEGRFLDIRHARERQIERQIMRSDVLHVLCFGYHEKLKDRFDDQYNAWNYAIRGKTLDRRIPWGDCFL